MRRMEDRPWRAPRLSGNAKLLMSLLMRTGGGMRVGPLLRITRLPVDDLATAANELIERSWIDIVWRGERARRPETLPERALNASPPRASAATATSTSDTRARNSAAGRRSHRMPTNRAAC